MCGFVVMKQLGAPEVLRGINERSEVRFVAVDVLK